LREWENEKATDRDRRMGEICLTFSIGDRLSTVMHFKDRTRTHRTPIATIEPLPVNCHARQLSTINYQLSTIDLLTKKFAIAIALYLLLLR
jgi:hypothetical protein